MIPLSATQTITTALSAISTQWDGKRAILEMQSFGYRHWRQMEWIGFYFQYQCGIRLSAVMTIPGPRYGKVEFDGLLAVPWDFKAHAMNTSSHAVIVNDSDAIANGIREYGSVGLILALGTVAYNDESRSFQAWHETLKGGLSAYSEQRIQRGAWSRLRKVAFELRQITLIQLTDETLVKCGSFQSEFRNSNGRPRRSKTLLDLEKIDDEIIGVIEF